MTYLPRLGSPCHPAFSLSFSLYKSLYPTVYTYLHATLLVEFCLHGWVEYGSQLSLFFLPQNFKSCVCMCKSIFPILRFLILGYLFFFFVNNPFHPFLYCFMVLVDARESAIYIGRRDRPKFCHVYSGKFFFHHHHHEAKSFDGFFLVVTQSMDRGGVGLERPF